MNDAVNRLAREMADAIAAAVASDPRVAACRGKARVEGFELQVSIEAVIGFALQSDSAQAADKPARRTTVMTAHDRRFLRSLRIAADETVEEIE
jgi:Asp/Glu/hydantoin racemase